MSDWEREEQGVCDWGGGGRGFLQLLSAALQTPHWICAIAL